MLSGYLALGIAALLAAGFAIGALLIDHLVGPRRSRPVKGEAYESGVRPEEDARGRFDVKFYLVAMLFLLFDIEAVFLLPWGVVYQQLLSEIGILALTSMAAFVGVLTVGLIYVWKKGVLSWA